MFKRAGGALLVVLGAAFALSVLDGRAISDGDARTIKTYHFTDKVVGAQISPTEAVFKVTDSRLGRGAGVQEVKLNGLKGTSRERTYYRGATATSRGSFTIGVPDSTGVAKLTGRGRDTSGTGKLAGSSATVHDRRDFQRQHRHLPGDAQGGRGRSGRRPHPAGQALQDCWPHRRIRAAASSGRPRQPRIHLVRLRTRSPSVRRPRRCPAHLVSQPRAAEPAGTGNDHVPTPTFRMGLSGQRAMRGDAPCGKPLLPWATSVIEQACRRPDGSSRVISALRALRP